jgi:hypothetical protein
VYLNIIDTHGNKKIDVTLSGEVPNFPQYEQPELIRFDHLKTLFP